MPARIASCLLVVALAVPAGASPPRKPTRSLLADLRGDAALPGGAYDIVCGDLAVGRKEVVATLRLAGSLTTALPLLAGEWRLGMNLNGTQAEFRSRRDTSGAMTTDVLVGGQSVRHTFVVDRTTLVWRVPRTAGGPLNRPRLSPALARAETNAGVPADSADTPGACPS